MTDKTALSFLQNASSQRFLGQASCVVPRMLIVSAIGLLVANCASAPSNSRGANSKEVGAFSDAKYGKASPRVVGANEDVPKGGGRYQVGSPYRVAGKTYVPYERPVGHSSTGMASWYGEAFHGRKTANGEIYDRRSFTAAHPTMPLPSYARVTNVNNGYSIIVRVNDRGPYHGGRIMDVSERVATALNFKHLGTSRIRLDYLGKAGIGGSDDAKLMASLRTDGTPATSPGVPGSNSSTVMVASAAPVRPAASLRPNTPEPTFTPTVKQQATPVPSSDDEEVAAETQDSGAIPAAASSNAFAPRPAASGVVNPVKGIPNPPDRPYDLGTIPSAGAPVGGGTARSATPARPKYASLSFTDHVTQLSKFQKGHPLAALPSPKFKATAKAVN